MGFSKKRALTTVRIPMRFNHEFEDTSTGEIIAEEVEVVHNYSLPTVKQRERYRRESVIVKGKKLRYGGANASWNLFQAIILSVEGYDDMPAEEQNKATLCQYFNDEITRLHVESGIEILMSRLESDEVEYEKKSVPSSGA